jgi:hypothetical protein
LAAKAYSGALTRNGLQVAGNRPDPQRTDEFGQVLRFRRRPGPPLVPDARVRPDDPETGSAGELARYEQEQGEPVDYRQRMVMNVIAIAIVTCLVGAGVWIADTIAAIGNDQDCVMQGRSNCAPIEAPAPKPQ